MNREQMRESLYGFEVRVPDERRVEERKLPDIQQMWQRSYEIVGMAATGMKNVEIAKVLSITPQTVSNTLNSELGMKRLSEIREDRDGKFADVQERIALLTQRALDIYEEILTDETTGASLDQKMKVSDTVMLELSGHRVANKVHAVSTSATLEEITAFKERGRKAAAEAGMLVSLEKKEDGTYEAKADEARSDE